MLIIYTFLFSFPQCCLLYFTLTHTMRCWAVQATMLFSWCHGHCDDVTLFSCLHTVCKHNQRAFHDAVRVLSLYAYRFWDSCTSQIPKTLSGFKSWSKYTSPVMNFLEVWCNFAMGLTDLDLGNEVRNWRHTEFVCQESWTFLKTTTHYRNIIFFWCHAYT